MSQGWISLDSGLSVATHNALAKVIIHYTAPLWLEGWGNNVSVRKSRTERGNVQRTKPQSCNHTYALCFYFQLNVAHYRVKLG